MAFNYRSLLSGFDWVSIINFSRGVYVEPTRGSEDNSLQLSLSPDTAQIFRTILRCYQWTPVLGGYRRDMRKFKRS